MSKNEYVPFLSEIVEVIKHTDIEYTFRMTYEGEVRPGQFFEVSIPKYGEETPDHKIGVVTQYIPDLKFENVDEAVAVVVGPPAMMRFSVKALLERGLKEEHIWISQERKMCCGLGKCGHCKIGNKYVCLDGPVFNYTQGKSLLD